MGYLYIHGWSYIAGVKFNSPTAARDMSVNEIKLLGIKAQGWC
ncbi:MAG: hypothetical protein AB1349_12620 [Elusimicrobiota bacterium]